MENEIEREIMDRIKSPGWVTSRGLVRDPAGQTDENEYAQIETVMKRLAKQGTVVLWRLKLQNEDTELLTVTKPGYELDKELDERGAWATAERY
jgi:predicted transcriptional regulator